MYGRNHTLSVVRDSFLHRHIPHYIPKLCTVRYTWENVIPKLSYCSSKFITTWSTPLSGPASHAGAIECLQFCQACFLDTTNTSRHENITLNALPLAGLFSLNTLSHTSTINVAGGRCDVIFCQKQSVISHTTNFKSCARACTVSGGFIFTATITTQINKCDI